MKILIKSFIAALLLMVALPINAAIDSEMPKQELRSTWVATVWCLNWPDTYSQGSEASIEAQKKQMVRMLDSLAVNNFNAINFQVRGMSDAMYKSSYEPWSQYISGTRGVDPGWDPLEFVVEECHKRGMECHAWVNPYRFRSSSTSGGYEGDGTGYIENGWVLENTGILNPGKEEVQNRVVDICKEIITNYDIDGMMFDDYYYNGASFSEDAADYAAYTSAGGELSQADWRRQNVHNLLKKLYNMIETTKPWIRFGQAPQGVTCRSQAVADKYGVEMCPVGYDNNYGSQYIDILGWLQDGLIDYISPQVYWTIGAESDYSKVVPWWSTIVKKFDRHLFVSHSISSLTSASSASSLGMSGAEASLKASGPNNTKYSEYANEILLNRKCSENGSAGSVFYSAKYIYKLGATISFGHYLKRTVFSHPALPPAMTWKTQATDQGKVSNLTYDEESLLTWDAKENVRYTVYAVPNGVDPDAFTKETDYLLGFTYENSYTIPEEYRSGYYYAVCVFDRYCNEWAPATWKAEYSESVAAPTLVSPETNTNFDDTFTFVWNAVDGAEKYALDAATDPSFLNVQKSIQTTETSVSVDDIYRYISKNTTIYWRVRAICKGKNDGVSETRSFVYQLVKLLTPEHETTGLDPKVNFSWTVTTEGAPVALEVANDENFEDVVLAVESTTGSYQAKILELHPLKTYYARVIANGKSSDYVMFQTKAMPCTPPTFKFPLDGGTCYSNSLIEVEPQDGAEYVYIQVDLKDTFGSTKCQKKLSDFVNSVAASDILISRKNPMEDGVTYYARAQVQYYDENGILTSTEWGPTISFVYSSASSVIESVKAESLVKIAGSRVVVKTDSSANVKVVAISMLGNSQVLFEGQSANEEISLKNLSSGLYIIQTIVNGEVHNMKYIKR